MSYHVSLAQFEGPLDLLLRLISAARVDIREIFVSNIVDQYLETVAHADESLSSEETSEFLVMASRLLEIKSRQLFIDPERGDEPDEDEQRLYEQLEQYRQYQERVESLKEREAAAADLFGRLPEEWVGETTLLTSDMTIQALIDAFLRVQDRMKAEAEPEEAGVIERETVSLQSRIIWLRRRIRAERRLLFSELLEGLPAREAITVFLAILELIHSNEMTARQDAPLAEIVLERKDEETESPSDDEEA